MSKLAIAVYSAAGCGGCDIAVLEIHEHLLELIEVADIAFWPTALDFKYADVEALEDGSIDACLFNGAIRTRENAEIAQLLRRKSKFMIAFGSCAAFGGVPGLANFSGASAILNRAFSTQSTDFGSHPPTTGHHDVERTAVPALFATVTPLSAVVDVDVTIPGCPPEGPRVWEVCLALASGQVQPGIAGAGDKCVCDECDRPKRGTKVKRFVRRHEIITQPEQCLLEQGVVCMGPATRSGCGARCMTASMPCTGCYGPVEGCVDQGAAMIAALGSVLESEEEDGIAEALEGIPDPAGTFYCFTQPDSILGRAARPSGGERT
jgi:F420-non-reducing hydrogenase small subunit